MAEEKELSPPTRRVIRVIDFLAARPDESFSVAKIARALGINNATCLAVLGQLARAGWVIRDPEDKSYRLGAAFLAIGRAAGTAFPALHHARIAVRTLTAAHGLPCVIVALEGDHMANVGCAGDVSRLHLSNRPGTRFPFVPPFGISFVAWGDRAQVEDWYAHSGDVVSAEDREWFEQVFASVRARGYGVDRLNEPVQRMRAVLADVVNDPLAQRVQPALMALIHELGFRAQVVDELREGCRFPVSVLYAPVFDASARPTLNLSLHIMRDDVAYEEVAQIGSELVAAAHEATVASGGRVPDPTGYAWSAAP